MKTPIACLAIALTLMGSTSYAGWPTKEEMAENYQTCMASDPSWYQRWGQYLASFDRDEAYAFCRSFYHGADIKIMGCYDDNHKWLKAGYYCYFD